MQDQASSLAQVVGVFKLNGLRAASVASAAVASTAHPQSKAMSVKPRTSPATGKSSTALAVQPGRRSATALSARGGEWEQF
jgi:hypothetical protein